MNVIDPYKGILFIHIKKRILILGRTWMNLKNLEVKEASQKIPHAVLFRVYKTSRMGKIRET